METRQECPLWSLLPNTATVGSSQRSKARRRNERHVDWREELKLCSQVPWSSSEESHQKLLELVGESSRVSGYKVIHTKAVVLLYTSKGQLQNEILNAIHRIVLKIWNILLICAKSVHWKRSDMAERNERQTNGDNITCSCIRRWNTGLSLLPKLINRFCAILVKILAALLAWKRESDCKIYMEIPRTMLADLAWLRDFV